MNRMISVVIPAYNCSEYIVDAVDSVLNQSYPNIEVLIIDDGSTDNTRQVVENYTKNASVKYIFQKNQGPGAARNTGLKSSHGDYICFLDADDYLKPGSMKSRADVLSSDEDLMLIFSEYSIRDTGGLNVENYLKYNMFIESFKETVDVMNDNVISFNNKFVDFFYAFSPHPIWTGTVMMKRQVLDSVGFFRTDISVSEDIDYWVRIAEKHKIAYLQHSTAVYNHYRSTLTKQSVEKYHKDRITSFLHAPINSSSRKAIIYKNISSSYFCLGHFYATNGRAKVAIKKYVAGLRYNIKNTDCLKGLLAALLPRSLKNKIKSCR